MAEDSGEYSHADECCGIEEQGGIEEYSDVAERHHTPFWNGTYEDSRLYFNRHNLTSQSESRGAPLPPQSIESVGDEPAGFQQSAGACSMNASGGIVHINTLPCEIESPGYYILDIDSSDADWICAIHITSSDVILDGNGHTLDSSADYDLGAVRIDEGANNITITNLTLTDWDYGIYWYNVSGGHITNNTIVSNDYGIKLIESDNNTLTNNTFVEDGLTVKDSHNNTVIGNTVNGKQLVYLENATDMTIEGSGIAQTAQGVSGVGQVILVGCDNITVSGANVSNTTGGIELWESDNCTL
ncbi:MAG: right-handed parallel beta-helix repeat-containing protein, partial [Methermicoccaceae archaeon]